MNCRNALPTRLRSPVSCSMLCVRMVALLLPAAFMGDRLSAAPPEPVAGIFIVEAIEVTSVQPAGEISLIELQAVFRFEGDLDGAFLADFFIVHLGPADQPAPEIFIAEGRYIGDVLGASGSFDFSFAGEIDSQANAEGQLVLRDGTDELRGLSGQIELSGTTGVGGTYAGKVHF